MNPTRSSTAAGSRITVYFPAGISLGDADDLAFRAATSARDLASRLATFGEFAFCHPEESPASMVMEISDEVCVYQSANPRELKIPSTDSELAKTPAVVSLCVSATATIAFTVSARCSAEIAAVSAKYRLGSAFPQTPASAGLGRG